MVFCLKASVPFFLSYSFDFNRIVVDMLTTKFQFSCNILHSPKQHDFRCFLSIAIESHLRSAQLHETEQLKMAIFRVENENRVKWKRENDFNSMQSRSIFSVLLLLPSMPSLSSSSSLPLCASCYAIIFNMRTNNGSRPVGHFSHS